MACSDLHFTDHLGFVVTAGVGPFFHDSSGFFCILADNFFRSALDMLGGLDALSTSRDFRTISVRVSNKTCSGLFSSLLSNSVLPVVIPNSNSGRERRTRSQWRWELLVVAIFLVIYCLVSSLPDANSPLLLSKYWFTDIDLE